MSDVPWYIFVRQQAWTSLATRLWLWGRSEHSYWFYIHLTNILGPSVIQLSSSWILGCWLPSLVMDANLSITLLFRSPVLRTSGKPNSDPFQYLWDDLNFFKVFREWTWKDGFSFQSSFWLQTGWNWVQSITKLIQVSKQILDILNIIHIIIFQVIPWPKRSDQTRLSILSVIVNIGPWQSWRQVKFLDNWWRVCENDLNQTIIKQTFRNSFPISTDCYQTANFPQNKTQSNPPSHHQKTHPHYQSQLQRCSRLVTYLYTYMFSLTMHFEK